MKIEEIERKLIEKTYIAEVRREIDYLLSEVKQLREDRRDDKKHGEGASVCYCS